MVPPESSSSPRAFSSSRLVFANDALDGGRSFAVPLTYAALATTNAALNAMVRNAVTHPAHCAPALVAALSMSALGFPCSNAEKTALRSAPTHATARIHSQHVRTPSLAAAEISFAAKTAATSSAAKPPSRSVVTFRSDCNGPRPRAPDHVTSANATERTKTPRQSCASVRAGRVPRRATAQPHMVR